MNKIIPAGSRKGIKGEDMAVQFVLGAAGSGKTQYMIRKLIERSVEHTDENFLYIVPEQFTMEAQRDIVTMHPKHGSMNIDAIGLNRLAYRVFDELSINAGQVLEDFGKSMLIQRILIENRDRLEVYGSYLNKTGFIDEMKSMISELIQYAVGADELLAAMESMDGESAAYRKLHDIRLIYESFEEHRRNEHYIVAEQLVELLADRLEESDMLRKSHLYFDGFTGFTPIQLKLIRGLIRHTRSVTFAFTIDADRIELSKPKEYELFRLTKETMLNIVRLAGEEHAELLDNVVLGGDGGTPVRFEGNAELAALAKGLFRYPHGHIDAKPHSISIASACRAGDEARYVASQVRALVRDGGYRYKDIAVVAGDLDSVASCYRYAMEEYDIPVFIDANISLAGDPCSDTVRAFLSLMSDNFSFDSMFRLLKSGMTPVDKDDIEHMENYALLRRLRGYSSWTKEIADDRQPDYAADMESVRRQIMSIFSEDCIAVYRPASPGSRNTVRRYTEELYHFLAGLDVYGQLEERKRLLYEAGRMDEGDAYGRICDKLTALFDKLVMILGDEELTVREYAGILDAGLSDMEIGIVPPTIDRVVVGDMMRSRLNHVKVLFFTGVNEGVIPKPPKKGRILSEADREKLESCGVTLAPSDKTNAYIEQLYIYTCLTKPTDRIYMVYRKQGEDMKPVKPSYLIDRIRSIFPAISIHDCDKETGIPETVAGTLRYMTDCGADELLELSDLLKGLGHGREVDAVIRGKNYVNHTTDLSPAALRLLYGDSLTESVSKLERYAECRFKYFMEYGLGLRERENGDIDAANVGIILHKTMELVFSYVRDNCGNDWEGMDEETLERSAAAYAEIAADREAGQAFDASERAAYMKKLIADIAVRTVKTLRTFVGCGDMLPRSFECRFNTAGDESDIEAYRFSLANGMVMSLKGVIDRIDEYTDGERLIYKIIDYKSSSYALDEKLVLGGLQMQLVTYAAIAGELERRRTKELGLAETSVQIGGMLYYAFDNPIVDVTSLVDGLPGEGDEEELERRKLKEMRYSGLYNSDENIVPIIDRELSTVKTTDGRQEVLIERLIKANRNNIERLANGIAEGKVDINPVNEGKTCACTYCSFKGICAFDSKYAGNSYTHIYRGEAEAYEAAVKALDELADIDKAVAKAQKAAESAEKKYKAVSDKVSERGDKATAKQKEILMESRKKFDLAQAELRELMRRRTELAEEV